MEERRIVRNARVRHPKPAIPKEILQSGKPERTKEAQKRLDELLMSLSRGGGNREIEMLLGEGANIHATDSDGMTALMHAAYLGYRETCRLLIGEGATIDAKDNGGWTALMHAAWQGRTKTCKLLIEMGADVNARDRHMKTALMLAAKENYFFTYHDCIGTCALLVMKGADVNAKDDQNNTALKNSGKKAAEAFLKATESMQETMGKGVFGRFFSAFEACLGQ